jgi:hypothetical protein
MDLRHHSTALSPQPFYRRLWIGKTLALPHYPLQEALDLVAQSEPLRVQRGNLELVVGKYNSILSCILPVEAALLAPQLAVIDAALGRGMTTDGGLTWRSLSIDEFVAESSVLVDDAYATLLGVQVGAVGCGLCPPSVYRAAMLRVFLSVSCGRGSRPGKRVRQRGSSLIHGGDICTELWP